jgi:hypothetical protein
VVKVLRRVLRRPVVPSRDPRHRIAPYRPIPRTHPWFEQRAQRVLELGPYR